MRAVKLAPSGRMSVTVEQPPAIVLATLNAKYLHASLGLRYLMANLSELQPFAQIMEFTIHDRPADIAERLLAGAPRIIGLGVYVWNAEPTRALLAILKRVSPQTTVVLGGPEVSHEWQEQPWVAEADYLITGQADLAFAQLCRAILQGPPPTERILHAGELDPAALALPYGLYTDEDIAHRLIYVEASRGCAFRCEFCLSSLDRTATGFELDRFLEAMAELHRRGVRQFKFVDRTFNLNLAASRRILMFFLERLDAAAVEGKGLFLHFELVPDRLPEGLKALLVQFPPGTLQLEVGVQTLQPEVQARIQRRQDNAATAANLAWLRHNTHAHLHADLIAGLPGETLAEFGAGFDQLVAVRPQEIQVGVLKRLPGAPIARHTAEFGLRFDPAPPYPVLATATWSFADLQRLGRLARYWDLVGNSGRFAHTVPVLLGEAPFARLLALSDWLYARTGKTHQLALDRLFLLLREGLVAGLGVDPAVALAALQEDYRHGGLRGNVETLGARMRGVLTGPSGVEAVRTASTRPGAVRQDRHLRGDGPT